MFLFITMLERSPKPYSNSSGPQSTQHRRLELSLSLRGLLPIPVVRTELLVEVRCVIIM